MPQAKPAKPPEPIVKVKLLAPLKCRTLEGIAIDAAKDAVLELPKRAADFLIRSARAEAAP